MFHTTKLDTVPAQVAHSLHVPSLLSEVVAVDWVAVNTPIHQNHEMTDR